MNLYESLFKYYPNIYNFHKSKYGELVKEIKFEDIPIQDDCAVVGTSSTLLEQPKGRIIDSYFVIRVNGVPSESLFLNYTGKRNDIHVGTYPVNPKHLTKRTVVYCHVSWFPSKCWNRIKTDKNYRISPYLVYKTRKQYRLNKKFPTSGLIAVEFAKSMCNKVHLFGFGINTSFSNCSHYYNVQNLKNPNKCSYSKKYGGKTNNSPAFYEDYVKSYWHNFSKEASFIKNKKHLINNY